MPGLAKREADQHCECVGAPPRESGGGTLCLNGAAAHAARRRRAAVCVCGASWPAPCRLMTSGGTELLEVVQVYGVGQDLLKAQGPLALQTLLGDGRRHPAGRRRHDARVARQLLAVLAGGAATNTATGLYISGVGSLLGGVHECSQKLFGGSSRFGSFVRQKKQKLARRKRLTANHCHVARRRERSARVRAGGAGVLRSDGPIPSTEYASR